MVINRYLPPNHWVERPAASFGWTVEAAAAHPLRYAAIKATRVISSVNGQSRT